MGEEVDIVYVFIISHIQDHATEHWGRSRDPKLDPLSGIFKTVPDPPRVHSCPKK